MRTCAIIHPLHLELETAQINKTSQIDQPPSLRKNKQAWENGMGSLVKSVTCTVTQ
jgi:hypothetical protein